MKFRHWYFTFFIYFLLFKYLQYYVLLQVLGWHNIGKPKGSTTNCSNFSFWFISIYFNLTTTVPNLRYFSYSVLKILLGNLVKM